MRRKLPTPVFSALVACIAPQVGEAASPPLPPAPVVRSSKIDLKTGIGCFKALEAASPNPLEYPPGYAPIPGRVGNRAGALLFIHDDGKSAQTARETAYFLPGMEADAQGGFFELSGSEAGDVAPFLGDRPEEAMTDPSRGQLATVLTNRMRSLVQSALPLLARSSSRQEPSNQESRSEELDDDTSDLLIANLEGAGFAHAPRAPAPVRTPSIAELERYRDLTLQQEAAERGEGAPVSEQDKRFIAEIRDLMYAPGETVHEQKKSQAELMVEADEAQRKMKRVKAAPSVAPDPKLDAVRKALEACARVGDEPQVSKYAEQLKGLLDGGDASGAPAAGSRSGPAEGNGSVNAGSAKSP